jgi:putative addiction module killer protein
MGYGYPMIEMRKTDEYSTWFMKLTDAGVRARINARLDRLADGNPGDVAPVGESVSELRLHFGCGWRVYFTQRGAELIILLAGGEKGTQVKDIKRAIALARNV